MEEEGKKLTTSGAELIAQERKRQIEEEGYDSKHDEGVTSGELMRAAEAYLDSAEGYSFYSFSKVWPWDKGYFKPKGVKRDLVRAGALIAAAIDKYQIEQERCKD